jgi:hypothetical protein
MKAASLADEGNYEQSAETSRTLLRFPQRTCPVGSLAFESEVLMNVIEEILRDRFRNYQAIKKDLIEIGDRDQQRIYVGLLCMADDRGFVGGNTSSRWIDRLNRVGEEDWKEFLNSLIDISLN